MGYFSDSGLSFYRSTRWEEEQANRQAIRERNIREAEEDRIRLTPKFHKENSSPARPAACQSCGCFHRGTAIRREELREIRRASSLLRADYSQRLAQVTERVAQCYKEGEKDG
jgi:hypothetical protein